METAFCGALLLALAGDGAPKPETTPAADDAGKPALVAVSSDSLPQLRFPVAAWKAEAAVDDAADGSDIADPAATNTAPVVFRAASGRIEAHKAEKKSDAPETFAAPTVESPALAAPLPPLALALTVLTQTGTAGAAPEATADGSAVSTNPAGNSLAPEPRAIPSPRANARPDASSIEDPLPPAQGPVAFELKISANSGQPVPAAPAAARTTEKVDSLDAVIESPGTGEAPAAPPSREPEVLHPSPIQTESTPRNLTPAVDRRTQVKADLPAEGIRPATPTPTQRQARQTSPVEPIRVAAPPVAVSAGFQDRPSHPAAPMEPTRPTVPAERAHEATLAEHIDAPQAAVKEISWSVQGPGSQNAHVRLIERAGEVLVSVRTPNQELARPLQNGLQDLVHRLQNDGFRVESSQPASETIAAADPGSGDAEPRFGAHATPSQEHDTGARRDGSHPDRQRKFQDFDEQ